MQKKFILAGQGIEFFRVEAPLQRPEVMKKFQKTLILASEVIMQPPKNTFDIAFF